MKAPIVPVVVLAALGLVLGSGTPAGASRGCGTIPGPAEAGSAVTETATPGAPLRTIERGDGARHYSFDPGMEQALLPLVDRVERGLERLAEDGWQTPEDRGRPLEVEIVAASGSAPVALFRPAGGATVRVDLSSVPAESLDRLAPEILHQVAHVILAGYAGTTGSWWAESTARHLAGRAEESGVPAIAAPPEGLAGPASPIGFGEKPFADAVASAVGEEGLVRIWEEARGTRAEDSLRRAFERLDGRRFEEFVFEHALLRESAASEARRALTSTPGTTEWNAGSPSGVAWWVARFRPEGNGGGEVLLDPAAGDFDVRLLVAYRAAERQPDVVELVAGSPVRVPLAGVARLSVVAAPRNFDRAPLAAPLIRFRGLADFPFRLDGPPRLSRGGSEASLSWSVSGQTDLLGWRIERRERTDAGELFSAETIIPASDEEDGSFSYRWVELDLEPGSAYSWEVEAVTSAGIMVEGFRFDAGSAGTDEAD